MDEFLASRTNDYDVRFTPFHSRKEPELPSWRTRSGYDQSEADSGDQSVDNADQFLEDKDNQYTPPPAREPP